MNIKKLQRDEWGDVADLIKQSEILRQAAAAFTESMVRAAGDDVPRPKRTGWLRVRCVGGKRTHISFYNSRPPFEFTDAEGLWLLDLTGDEPVYFVEG